MAVDLLKKSASAIPERGLDAVREGIRTYCERNFRFEFDSSRPHVRLHEPTFGADEINAAIDVLLTTRVTMGPKVFAFEQEFARAFRFGESVMSNSGSSANLLAIAALANVAVPGCFKPGDEVIVPALAWSTTVWPLIQHNLIPVVVDIDPRTLNIDPSQVERAIGPRTRGLMPVHVYGNPCDMAALRDLSQRHELILVEDCCEALGAYYDDVPVGKFGRVGTFSFYFSHHMTTLEGGVSVTDDFDLAEMMRILRAHGWTRELKDRERYSKKYPDMDPRFTFVNLGYNLRATELQAAIGSVQLPKLSQYVETRRENTAAWRRDLGRWGEYFDFQEETPKGRSSCFGFPLTVKPGAPFGVKELSTFLNKAGIETRPIICGNIALQPAMELYPHRVVGDLRHATNVMRNGMSFGNHHAVGKAARDYVTAQFESFLARHGR